MQEFTYYGSIEVKQDKIEKFDESLKEEETKGFVGDETTNGVEDKNKQKWVIISFLWTVVCMLIAIRLTWGRSEIRTLAGLTLGVFK